MAKPSPPPPAERRESVPGHSYPPEAFLPDRVRRNLARARRRGRWFRRVRARRRGRRRGRWWSHRLGPGIRPALLAGAAVFSIWGAAVVLEELAGGKAGTTPEGSAGAAAGERRLERRMEGLASLVALAAERPPAMVDLLLDCLADVELHLSRDGERDDLRWLHFLLLEGLGRGEEAASDLGRLGGALPETAGPSTVHRVLAAMGDILGGRPERAAGRLEAAPAPGEGLLLSIARASALPRRRRELVDRLLEAGDHRVRLLGAAWGIEAGHPAAREAILSLPLEGAGVARMLVELGEEEAFLEKANPGRIDLAPLRIEVLLRRGERAEARRLAGHLLALAPDSFELRLHAARLFREEEDPELALEHLRAATLLRPDSPGPMREWLILAGEGPDRPRLILPCADLFFRRVMAGGRAILEGGGRAAVLPPSAGTPEEDPGGPERLLIAAGFGLPGDEADRARALAALEGAALDSPDPAPVFLLGRAHFAEGRWARAAERFVKAEDRADPADRPVIRAWRAASLRRGGKEAEARAEEVVLGGGGEDLHGRALEAALSLLRDPEEARRLLERSLEARPHPEPAAVRLARILLGEGPEAGGARAAALVLARRADLEGSGDELLGEYARALEWSSEWPVAAQVLDELARRDPGRPGRRARASWAWISAGERARAALSLRGGELGEAVSAADPPGEVAMMRAFLAASRGDAEATEGWLSAAVRREPTDPRPRFLRGYFRRLRGSRAAAERDWDEVLGLWGPPGEGAPATEGAALEPEGQPWALAIIHAARGDLAGARWYAPLGPRAGVTPPGSFFRSAALAGAGDWPGAEEEALRYRSRGFPIFSWQALDPSAGALFSGSFPEHSPQARTAAGGARARPAAESR